jgi:hypothetical protein
MSVFHYTSILHLPHIIAAKALMPGRGIMGGFPQPDFLWATKSYNVDRTATCFNEQYRTGKMPIVRLTLPEAEFGLWGEALGEWPEYDVNRLEASAKALGVDPRAWRVRKNSLMLDTGALQAVDYRYYNGTWRLLEHMRVQIINDDTLAIELGSDVFVSRKVLKRHAPTVYVGGKRAIA